MDVASSCDVPYLFFDALNLLFHSFQRNSVHDNHHPDHMKVVSDLDLGIGEWEWDPEQKGIDRYVQRKVEQGLNLVGVHEKTVSSHDGAFSFYHDLLSQWIDLLIVHLANPASKLLSGTDGEEALVAYTDHNIVILYWNEGCSCDDTVVVLGLPFSGIDEGDSVEEGEGDTCSRD